MGVVSVFVIPSYKVKDREHGHLSSIRLRLHCLADERRSGRLSKFTDNNEWRCRWSRARDQALSRDQTDFGISEGEQRNNWDRVKGLRAGHVSRNSRQAWHLGVFRPASN